MGLRTEKCEALVVTLQPVVLSRPTLPQALSSASSPAPAAQADPAPPREKLSLSANVLQATALVGIPSAVGALEHSFLGAANSALLTVAVGPTAGAFLGAGILGVSAWKATRGNPVYTVLAGLGGMGVGTVAWPLLKLPGALGGWTGAAVATGLAGAAAAGWVLSQAAKRDIGL